MTPTDERFPALTSRALAPPDWEARALLEATQLRERLSCVPFYAKRAAAWQAQTGQEMGYWLDLYGNRQWRHMPLTESSTAGKLATNS